MLYSLLFAQCCTRACFKIKKCTKHLFYSLIYGKIKKKGADIMLRRYELTDQEWEQVASLLPPEKTGKAGRPSKDNRIMLNGMVWIARSGAPWRDLPERYGPWNSVYNRFRKWVDDGILDNIFRVLSLEAELCELSLDATIVQAHQHSAGAKKGDSKRNWPQPGMCQSQNPCSRRCLWLSCLSNA